MMSLRSLTRSIPRALTKVPATTIQRPFSMLPRSSPLQSSWKASSTPQLAAAFSTSRMLAEEAGAVDQELAAKLESELSMEKQMGDIASLRKELKAYLDEGPFKLNDTPGTEELTLTRKFGSETITITFSIDDLNNLDADPEDAEADAALYDEDEPMDAQSGGAQTINAGKADGEEIAVAPEDKVSAADQADGDAAAAQETMEEDEEEDEPAPSFPAHLHIAVEKPGKGSLQIEALAQDGLIAIENVYYYTKEGKKFLTAARAGNAPEGVKEPYVGPQFANLDEDLQVLLERFLEERGVDTRLALFVPEYIEWKEQQEYVRWLENVKTFVEA